MEFTNAMKTGKALEWAIDNADEIDGMKEYLDQHFAYLMFDLDYGSTPTFQEALDGALFEPADWMLEGSIDYAINGVYEYETENLLCEYIPGFYEPLNYGDIKIFDGIKYKYISSISLPEEIEHQADNGYCAYEYRGYSFVRIWDSNINNNYPAN